MKSSTLKCCLTVNWLVWTTILQATIVGAFVAAPSTSTPLQSALTVNSRCQAPPTLLQATRGSGGFGKGLTSQGTKKKKKKVRSGPQFTFDKGPGIQNYLDPRLFDDPATLQTIQDRLRAGEIVVIRNAFLSEFAEAMYQELYETDAWSRNEDYFADGYHFRHYNVYDKTDFSPLFLSTNDIFDSDETKAFMSELTGRDCSGESVGAPSWYGSGDHSLPHTDHIGQRTIAYIWHLSKQWRPEWGGGLYWCSEPLANAYLHASFNTLVLFSVSPHSVRVNHRA